MNLRIILCAVIIGLFHIPVNANRTKQVAQQIILSYSDNHKSNMGSTPMFEGVVKILEREDARPCRTQKKARLRSEINEQLADFEYEQNKYRKYGER